MEDLRAMQKFRNSISASEVRAAGRASTQRSHLGRPEGNVRVDHGSDLVEELRRVLRFEPELREPCLWRA